MRILIYIGGIIVFLGGLIQTLTNIRSLPKGDIWLAQAESSVINATNLIAGIRVARDIPHIEHLFWKVTLLFFLATCLVLLVGIGDLVLITGLPCLLFALAGASINVVVKPAEYIKFHIALLLFFAICLTLFLAVGLDSNQNLVDSMVGLARALGFGDLSPTLALICTVSVFTISIAVILVLAGIWLSFFGTLIIGCLWLIACFAGFLTRRFTRTVLSYVVVIVSFLVALTGLLQLFANK